MAGKKLLNFQLINLLGIIIFCNSGFVYADSTLLNTSAGAAATPSHQVIKSILPLSTSTIFATANQTIYSSTVLAPLACPSGANLAYTSPVTTYTVTTKYYATHFHYECAATAFGCSSSNGNDPSVSALNGQSLTEPSTVCDPSHYANCQHSEYWSCHYNFCSNTSGTWYTVYVYTPDPNGSYTGGQAVCVTQGWVSGPQH